MSRTETTKDELRHEYVNTRQIGSIMSDDARQQLCQLLDPLIVQQFEDRVNNMRIAVPAQMLLSLARR